jgi:chromosome segregation ATPase
MSEEKTWGVKASQDEVETAEKLFEASGLKTKKEFFPFMLNATKLMLMKEGAAIEYKKDLTELQTLTGRMISLFTNMIQQEETAKEDLRRRIEELQVQITNIQAEHDLEKSEFRDEIKQAQEQLKELVQEKSLLAEQLESTKLANRNYEDLVSQYKDKIDSLSGVIDEYKADREENKRLRQVLVEQKEEFDQIRSQLQSEVDQLEKQLNVATRAMEQKELEMEKALVEAQRKYQEELNERVNEYNDKVRGLLNEKEQQRREHEVELKRRLDELAVEYEKRIKAMEQDFERKNSVLTEENDRLIEENKRLRLPAQKTQRQSKEKEK